MLKITIEAETGENRSSVAVFLADAFRNAGIEVEIKDGDIMDKDLRTQAQLAADAIDRLRVAAGSFGKVLIETAPSTKEG